MQRVVGILWLVCLCTGQSFGQTADRSGETGPSRSTFYETATVRARPLDSATASVTVLDREAIESLGVSSVAELIRFVPGLNVVSNGPRGGLAFAQVRGGDPNFTVVLLDGVPLNDTTDQFGGVVDLNSLPAVHVERVEVVRGPVSSRYGSAGLAGAINVITRQGGSDQPALDFQLAAGDAAVLQSAASLSGGDVERNYFLGLSWEQEEDRVAQDAFDRLNLLANARVPLGTRSALRVKGRVATREGEDYPDASGGPTFGSGETRRSDHDEAGVGLEWQLGAPERPHRVEATIYRHELDRQSPEITDPADPFAFVPASVKRSTYTRWHAGWAYPVATGRLNLDVGLEATLEDGDNDSSLFLPPTLGGGVIDGSYRLDRGSGGAFVELVARRGRLLLELGARLDLSEGFDPELNPRAGISYRFAGESTRLLASVARAFKLPSFFVLGSPDALGGNPNLEPEASLGGDAGIEHTFESARLTTSLKVFHLEFEDLIDFEFDLSRCPAGASVGCFVNRSEVESTGAELSLGWRPGERIRLEANLTRQEVEDQQSGQTLRHRPDRIGGLRFDWEPTERLRWELDGQWVAESTDRQVPVPQRSTVAGYQLFGSALAFRLSPQWELRGRVDNLADKQYESLIGFPGPGRAYRVALRHGRSRVH